MHFDVVNTLAPLDPNWYLSTTAQSAAALVAIIGGFLLQKTLTLKSSIMSLKQRKNVLTKKREITERQKDIAQNALLLSNTKRFFSHHFTAYAKFRNDENLNFDTLWKIYRPWDIELGDKEKIEKFLREAVTRKFADKESESADENPNDDVELSSLGISQARVELLDFIERRLNDPTFSSEIKNSESGRARRKELVSNYDDLRYEIEMINADLEGIDAELQDTEERRHLSLGFTIVFVFGTGGVLFPLIVMAGNSPGRDRTTFWVLGLFTFGYSAFFIYVFYLVRSVQDKSKSAENDSVAESTTHDLSLEAEKANIS